MPEIPFRLTVEGVFDSDQLPDLVEALGTVILPGSLSVDLQARDQSIGFRDGPALPVDTRGWQLNPYYYDIVTLEPGGPPIPLVTRHILERQEAKLYDNGQSGRSTTRVWNRLGLARLQEPEIFQKYVAITGEPAGGPPFYSGAEAGEVVRGLYAETFGMLVVDYDGSLRELRNLGEKAMGLLQSTLEELRSSPEGN